MKMPRNYSKFLIHPLTVFVSVWLLCFLLYAMHLSDLLIVETSQVEVVVEWIILPFVITIVAVELFYLASPKLRPRFERVDVHDNLYLRQVERRLDRWFWYWLVLTAIEIIFSGGIPILWLVTGSSKTYVDFGLPVIHVVAGSLLTVISLAKFGLYLLRGNWRRLFIPIFQLAWGVVVVSRGEVVTVLIQLAVLWFCLKRVTFKIISRITVISILVIFLFGYIGDSRSAGSQTFRDLARPTANYPDWLPSGVLWFYIYITSPLDNLVYTAQGTKPSYSILFPKTTYFLFPTVIRNAIYGKDPSIEQEGDLVESSLNVSSAYIGPFVDYGYTGIGCFSVLMGLVTGYLWKKRRTLRDDLMYCIFAQCLALSIFWNYLLYFPFLVQIFWIYLLFSQRRFRLFLTMPLQARRETAVS